MNIYFMKSVIKKIFSYTPIGGYVSEKIYDKRLLKTVKTFIKPNSNCIEIGCYKGAMLRNLLKLAPEGNHFGFEPIPDLFHDLNKTVGRLPNVRIYNYALSDKKDVSSFVHLMSKAASSGLERKRYNGSNDVLNILVSTERLDNLIAADTSIDFINIEVEGGEEQILRGGLELIRKNKPFIAFQHIKGVAEFYSTTPESLYNLLVNEAGLIISTLSRFINKSEPLDIQEFKSIYQSGTHHYYIAYSPDKVS